MMYPYMTLNDDTEITHSEYSYAAETPVQFRLSHLSRRSEPLYRISSRNGDIKAVGKRKGKISIAIVRTFTYNKNR